MGDSHEGNRIDDFVFTHFRSVGSSEIPIDSIALAVIGASMENTMKRHCVIGIFLAALTFVGSAQLSAQNPFWPLVLIPNGETVDKAGTTLVPGVDGITVYD